MKHLNLPTEFKSVGESGTFEGYASIFGNLNVIDRAFHNRPCHTEPGIIMVCDIDSAGMDPLRALLSEYPELSIGAMGTRAKQQAMAIRSPWILPTG